MAGIGVIGSGVVGKTLAAGFARHGHDVLIGSRLPSSVAGWAAENGVSAGDFSDAARREVVILAVAGSNALEAVRVAGIENLAGKVVIDACNPIAGPPVNGILPYFTGPNDSLMQRLQAAAPGARFVKAFNSVGNAFMIDPPFRATMFICGNDASAKAVVTGLLSEMGWESEDVGAAEGAGPVEALCQIWCAPGILRGDWAHAFAFVRP